MDKELLKGRPFGQYEYVTATFAAANTDTVVPFSQLRPAAGEVVHWQDVTPNSATSTVPLIYASTAPGRLSGGAQFLVLRSTVAGYTTRLLLSLERA